MCDRAAMILNALSAATIVQAAVRRPASIDVSP